MGLNEKNIFTEVSRHREAEMHLNVFVFIINDISGEIDKLLNDI